MPHGHSAAWAWAQSVGGAPLTGVAGDCCHLTQLISREGVVTRSSPRSLHVIVADDKDCAGELPTSVRSLSFDGYPSPAFMLSPEPDFRPPRRLLFGEARTWGSCPGNCPTPSCTPSAPVLFTGGATVQSGVLAETFRIAAFSYIWGVSAQPGRIGMGCWWCISLVFHTDSVTVGSRDSMPMSKGLVPPRLERPARFFRPLGLRSSNSCGVVAGGTFVRA